MGNLCFLKSKNKEEAIEEVISCCSSLAGLSDVKGFLDSVLERETLGSTCLGHGVIAAHGQVQELGEVHVGLGISKKGFFIDSSQESVHFLLVFCSDPKRYDLYVKRLSLLLGMLHDEKIRSKMLEGMIPETLIKDLG